MRWQRLYRYLPSTMSYFTVCQPLGLTWPMLSRSSVGIQVQTDVGIGGAAPAKQIQAAVSLERSVVKSSWEKPGWLSWSTT